MINYFTEKEVTLYNDVKKLCLKYLGTIHYDLDNEDIPIYEHKKDVDWEYICEYKKMSIDFIEAYIHKFSMMAICQHQRLNISFIEKYKNKIDMNDISSGVLNIKIIDKYYDELDWDFISKCAEFDENVIKKYLHKINWKLFAHNNYINVKLKNKYKYIWKIYCDEDSDSD